MTDKQQSTRSVTTEQAGEQMSMLARLRTKGGSDGGAAGSTLAFLETTRASRKPARKKLWRMEEEKRTTLSRFYATVCRNEAGLPGS